MTVRKQMPLGAILVAAAIARYWAIGFCLPGLLCRPDEEAVSGIALKMFTRDFNPHFFDWPALFFYETTAALAVYFKTGLLLGWFRGEYHFFQTIVVDASPLFLIARLLSATAGVASVWVLFRIARRLFGETTALVAAMFLALAYLHVRDSHFGVTDVTATCLVLVAFLFIVRYRESLSRRDLILAAVTTGLAASTKYNAGLIALPALWVIVRPAADSRSALPERFRLAAIFSGVMLGAFAVTSPYCFIEFGQFVAALKGISAHLAGGHGAMLGRGWTVHLTLSLRYGLGLPLLVAGVAGLALLLWRHTSTGIVVALFPVTYYLLIGSGYTVFARYIMPVVPFLCLGASLIIVESGRAVAAWRRRATLEPAVTWGLALLVVAPSAWSVLQFDRLLGQADTRLLAARWVEQRFPDGANIVQIGRRSTNLYFLPENASTPSRYMTTMWTEGGATVRDPDLIVVPTSLFDAGVEMPAAAMAVVMRYTPLYEVAAHDLLSTGVVYDWQDEFYLPLAGFASIERPGPNLTIYVRPDLASRFP